MNTATSSSEPSAHGSADPGARAAERGFLPFALPDIGPDEIAEVVDTLSSGWITTGTKTRRFEQDFAAFVGGDAEAIAVNSATAGLHLVLEALGIGPGDEIITTSYTFTATAEVARYLGAHPVLVDIDRATMNIDVAAIESRITPRTKAIIVVHFGGLACAMPDVLSLARRRGVAVVEDAAHAFPATCDGRLIGALDSDATVYSFYATKTITTGEGGMIVTRRRALAERCRVMRLHGISRDSFDRYTSRTPAWHYEVVAPGFKYNLTDIASALGIHQLRRAIEMRDRRAAIARQYDAGIADLPCVPPPHARTGDEHAWHLYVVRLRDDAPVRRDAFIDAMAAAGIGCSVHFIPLHLHPYWRDTYALREEDFPVAQDTFRRAVSLPIYSRMTPADVARVIDAVRSLLARR
jgi:dTDP-4-amino-4,6-dideoxygalactose transaminase